MRWALIVASPLWPMLAFAELSGEAMVVDAETIEVDRTRFRLYGIDAPEPDETCRNGAAAIPCGRIAATALMDLVAGASVRCVPIANANEPKTAEPAAATCRTDGYPLLEGMVYTDWAHAVRVVSRRYVEFENGAAAAGRGLWRTEFVMRGRGTPASACPIPNSLAAIVGSEMGQAIAAFAAPKVALADQ
jgi:endonuclease YncB( thermonuclease family)